MSATTLLPDDSIFSWITGDCLAGRPSDAHGNVDPDQTCCDEHRLWVYQHIIRTDAICAHILSTEAACDCGASTPAPEAET